MSDLTANLPDANLASVAQTIRTVRMEDLPPEQYKDVFELHDWLRDTVLAVHEKNEARTKELDERESKLLIREKIVAAKMRALTTAQATHGSKILRYLRG